MFPTLRRAAAQSTRTGPSPAAQIVRDILRTSGPVSNKELLKLAQEKDAELFTSMSYLKEKVLRPLSAQSVIQKKHSIVTTPLVADAPVPKSASTKSHSSLRLLTLPDGSRAIAQHQWHWQLPAARPPSAGSNPADVDPSRIRLMKGFEIPRLLPQMFRDAHHRRMTEKKTNRWRKYWMRQSNLVIKAEREKRQGEADARRASAGEALRHGEEVLRSI